MVAPTLISNLALILAGFSAAFLAALWVALVIWTYRDIRARVKDRLVHILAAALAAILFLPGVIIYLVIRPTRTLEAEYQASLEEEVLLQSIEEMAICPGCERQVREDWLVCPTCQTKLRKPCHQCNKQMELSWNICPYCGTPAPGMRREGGTLEEATRETGQESG